MIFADPLVVSTLPAPAKPPEKSRPAVGVADTSADNGNRDVTAFGYVMVR